MLTEEQKDLRRLIRRIDAAAQSLEKADFCDAVSRALRVLDIGDDEAARMFGTQRPTVQRWARGEAAPATQGRGPRLAVLLRRAQDKLRASEDLSQRVCRLLLNTTGEKATKRERELIEAICALVEPELRRANDPRNYGWDDPHCR